MDYARHTIHTEELRDGTLCYGRDIVVAQRTGLYILCEEDTDPLECAWYALVSPVTDLILHLLMAHLPHTVAK